MRWEGNLLSPEGVEAQARRTQDELGSCNLDVVIHSNGQVASHVHTAVGMLHVCIVHGVVESFGDHRVDLFATAPAGVVDDEQLLLAVRQGQDVLSLSGDIICSTRISIIWEQEEDHANLIESDLLDVHAQRQRYDLLMKADLRVHMRTGDDEQDLAGGQKSAHRIVVGALIIEILGQVAPVHSTVANEC